MTDPYDQTREDDIPVTNFYNDNRWVHIRDAVIALAVAAVVIVLIWVIADNVHDDRDTKNDLRRQKVIACQTVQESSARAGCITFAGR